MAKYVTIMDIARELGISKSTVSRALKGRAGHPSSKVYLGSAATVTASAVAGEIATADRV